MQFNDIVSISGMPGLYKMVAKREDGMIVSSLQDGKSKFVSSRLHFFSPLESITIYTETDSVDLVDVFQKMEKAESEQPVPSHKDSADKLKSYLETVQPDYDKEKVYVSDIKKMIRWYHELKSHKVAFEIPKKETPEEKTGDNEATSIEAKKSSDKKPQKAKKADKKDK